MKNNLEIFRNEFLGTYSWERRKNGVPLDVLDNLTDEEKKTAEIELIEASSLQDKWPIIALGHLKSKDALPALYNLLEKSNGSMKVVISRSIFQICQDTKMIELILEIVPKITNESELIDILYYLPSFKDKRVTDLHHSYRNHKDYLVAYNATRYLGISTNKVVEKFRDKKQSRSIWDRLLGK